MMVSRSQSRLRLFLDAGVIIEGCSVSWGFAKGVLILATLRQHYSVILAEPIADEVADAVKQKRRTLPPERAAAFASDLNGWFARVRVERTPVPSDVAVAQALFALLPALRHKNDLPAVVAAIAAQPDWVISTNRAHWNDDLATRSGLRIATPQDFLLGLRPQA